MTEQTQPTDAEISACILAAKVKCVHPEAVTTIEIARAVLAKWGTPAGAGEPDFYTACAWHEGGGEAGWIPLPGYSNETEHGVKHLVLEAARKEGYKGTAAGRLLELGWEIRPVYLTPQPTQAQAGAVPTRAFLERTLAAMEGVIDVADRKTDEFDALRSCVIDLTLMLFSDAKRHTKGACHER